MTREQKIEALAKEEYDDWENQESFKAGVLAGIRLRDEELLAMKFDEANATSYADGHYHYSAFSGTNEECFLGGARWQHEQFMKAIRSPAPEGEKEGE